MDKISDDGDCGSGPFHQEARPDLDCSTDDAERSLPVFIVNSQLEICGFNPSLIHAFAGQCERKPLLYEPVAIIPFYAINLAGEEQDIETVCRNAFSGSLLRTRGWLRLAERSLPLCLEFIVICDGSDKTSMLVVTMLGLHAADIVTPPPISPASDGSLRSSRWEQPPINTQDFQTTFNLAAVGIAHVGLDGQWLRVNRRLCGMLDYTREELLATTFRAVTYQADLETSDTLLQETLDGKRSSYVLEKRYVRKDGSLTWAHLAVSLLRDQAGHPMYFICVAST